MASTGPGSAQANADEWITDFSRATVSLDEIVNDEVGGVPLTVTFCPLCNTTLAFRRAFDGLLLDFGTTGLLRHSDMVMYDRQTETWWQQATGEGTARELLSR
ncbi:MAG: DUF3179 domain-containing protein [Gemmatimonadetes bacterium]|nr:DUF3179 domain-containing protein [Gemmatimonadota bacterium]NNM03787.1 DUF3179 domain-containing protein [Gemmatimonadota bacterium]